MEDDRGLRGDASNPQGADPVAPKGVVGQRQFIHTLFGIAARFLSDPTTAIERLTSVFLFATDPSVLRLGQGKPQKRQLPLPW
jgi:hypothetical protein